MVNHYETAFVLTPVLSEPQTKEAVEKFENLLTQNGGTILNREEWGLKQLAYPIQGKNSGFYFILQFDAEPAVIATLETEFRRDERIIRFLTTRLDKYAFEYAEKRRRIRRRKSTAVSRRAVSSTSITKILSSSRSSSTSKVKSFRVVSPVPL